MPVGEEVPGGSIGPEAAIESAKSMIGALFGLMLIRHVVVVDDEWASRSTLKLSLPDSQRL